MIFEASDRWRHPAGPRRSRPSARSSSVSASTPCGVVPFYWIGSRLGGGCRAHLVAVRPQGRAQAPAEVRPAGSCPPALASYPTRTWALPTPHGLSPEVKPSRAAQRAARDFAPFDWRHSNCRAGSEEKIRHTNWVEKWGAQARREMGVADRPIQNRVEKWGRRGPTDLVARVSRSQRRARGASGSVGSIRFPDLERGSRAHRCPGVQTRRTPGRCDAQDRRAVDCPRVCRVRRAGRWGGASFDDGAYEKAGADLVDEAVWNADVILKINPPTDAGSPHCAPGRPSSPARAGPQPRPRRRPRAEGRHRPRDGCRAAHLACPGARRAVLDGQPRRVSRGDRVGQ